jgi:hypothetical protein
MGLPMNLKLFTAVAIFATVAFAQMMTGLSCRRSAATKPSSKRIASWVSFEIRCRKLKTENDTKAVDALVAKADPLAQQIGPEYLKIVEGLEQVDPNSAEGQRFAAVFEPPRKVQIATNPIRG